MFEVDELVQRHLDSILALIPDNMPTFRGISVDKFDRKNLIKLCKLFANEWRKAQERYFSVLKAH